MPSAFQMLTSCLVLCILLSDLWVKRQVERQSCQFYGKRLRLGNGASVELLHTCASGMRKRYPFIPCIHVK